MLRMEHVPPEQGDISMHHWDGDAKKANVDKMHGKYKTQFGATGMMVESEVFIGMLRSCDCATLNNMSFSKVTVRCLIVRHV